MRAASAPSALQDVEVSYAGEKGSCKVDPEYTEIYWYGLFQTPPAGSKLQVRWVFQTDPRWYGEVKALPAAEQGEDGAGKLSLLKEKYDTAGKDRLLVKSGKPGKPQKTKAGYWPVWKYEVTIWGGRDAHGTPVDLKCGADPGVCVRGAGGACEI